MENWSLELYLHRYDHRYDTGVDWLFSFCWVGVERTESQSTSGDVYLSFHCQAFSTTVQQPRGLHPAFNIYIDLVVNCNR